MANQKSLLSIQVYQFDMRMDTWLIRHPIPRMNQAAELSLMSKKVRFVCL